MNKGWLHLPVGMMGLVGCGSSTSSAAGPHGLGVDAVFSQAALGSKTYTDAGSYCQASSGYTVAVESRAGTVLGTEQIDPQTGGTWLPTATGYFASGCAYHLDFSSVPAAATYGVVVGSGSPVWFSASDARSHRWDVMVAYDGTSEVKQTLP